MLLNRKYYQDLWYKYQKIETLTAKLDNNASTLTIKIILDQYKNKKSVHFNFPRSNNCLHNICQNLFIELANDIYCNAADFPPLKKGDILRDKRNYTDKGQEKFSYNQ